MGRGRARWSDTASELLYGTLAGVVGAACMEPLRIAARRAGWIDKGQHQAMEETFAHKLGLGHRRDPAAHHLADYLLHFGYGGVQGALYRMVMRGRGKAVTRSGLAFGALSW